MTQITADIAIIGAGMAGASLAAFIGDRARVVLLEAEARPGYHATGRSAAFWSESYGGPGVQPLTTASGPWLAREGMLHPRGCLHVADTPGLLDRLAAELDGAGVAWRPRDRAELALAIPGLAAGYTHGIEEPSCQDIDVAAVHARFLADARAGGAQLRCDAAVLSLRRTGPRWLIETRAGSVAAGMIVNAAGAWAGRVAALAGARPVPITPYRRTVVQLVTDPQVPPDMPLIMDGRGHFYFKPAGGGKLWLSPHDESAVEPHDVAPEELDQAIAIERLQQVVDWRVLRREHAWAGLRSFAPDRLPVYGFDPDAPGFFWCAGQGGFGIQTAPAAGMLGAALILGASPPAAIGHIDATRYAPGRFAQP